MSSQVTVYTSVSAQVWNTDRCQIATGNTAVQYNVAIAPDFANTIFSSSVQVPANNTRTVIVGVGNKLTITGANFTAAEYGVASSGTAGH